MDEVCHRLDDLEKHNTLYTIPHTVCHRLDDLENDQRDKR